jgi:hypothetical protein
VLRRGEIFALAAIGLLLGVAIVLSWGWLGPEPGSRNPSGWLGMLAVVAPNNASKAHLLYLLVPALALLTACWVGLLRLASVGCLTTRVTAFIAGCWSLPFVIGPVIGSRDAYAYVAQGELARRGFDPARTVVSHLGAGPLVAAVDPRWRDTRPPYGGVAVAIQKGAAAAGDGRSALALVVLRLVALAAVLVLIVVTARMADPARRPVVVAAMAANPLVLIHLVAGAHLDAVAAALLMSGLAIGLGADWRRRWIGVLLCTLGAMVKLPVALGACYLSLCAVIAAGPSLTARLRSVASDALAAAVGVGLSIALSGTGLAWIHNFGTPGRLRTGIAPADISANVVRGLGWLVGWHPHEAHVLSAARLIVAGIGVAIALFLLRPRRVWSGAGAAHWVPPSLNQLAAALLALGLLGPVLYGWYLAPALPLLALAAPTRRPAYWAIVGLSTVLTFATIPSLAPAWANMRDHPVALTVTLSLLLAAVVLAIVLYRAVTGDAGKRLTGRRAKGHNLDESALVGRL